MSGSKNQDFRHVLGRVTRAGFVGRTDELSRIIAQTSAENAGRGMLLLMTPSAGVSELLRQAYDQIFNSRSDVIPVYFAFTRNDRTAVSAAIEFLNTFLHQYITFRRNDPSLIRSSLTLQDIVELAPPGDAQWIQQLVESFNQLRFSNDDKALVRFCLSAPQRVPRSNGRPFVMLDGAQLAEYINGSVVLGREVMRVFDHGGVSFILAGLRRQILDAAHQAGCDFETLDTLRLDPLDPEDAKVLVEHVARRQHVITSREVRDLLVHQFAGSPFFINNFLQAAREKNVGLISYLDCERLYVDELLGGHLHHHFAALLEETAPRLDTRHGLIRILWEAIAGEEVYSTFESWRRKLYLHATELKDILHRLHVQEFINWNQSTIQAGCGSQAWKDYLKVRYRLDVENQPRALIAADSLSDALKRAPHTIARHYRRMVRFDLRDFMSRFDCQTVPAVLLDNGKFKKTYLGMETAQVTDRLHAEAETLKLPQTVHVATCASFSNEMKQVCEEDRCVVAHTFSEGSYSDSKEVVWLVVEIESKLEVDPEVAEVWSERLASLANRLGFRQFQTWLISNEGFSDEASQLLEGRSVFTSSRQQIELLGGELGDRPVELSTDSPDEFLMVVPMGEENELIAATAVEHVARRLPFSPEAINQIKTAIVEACINAAEHSFSPERKIYQRFRVGNDKLVVTISSRGIVPVNIGTDGANTSNTENDDAAEERRGWGLKLIRTLMDEVEFERVDEGTSLRMTKYLRNSSS